MRRGERGFTLLEMLVAVLVFSALVSLVYGMVRMGGRSWESGSERIAESDAMRIGWSFLYRALGNARAVPTRQEEGEGVHFIGEPEALEFVADMPAYLGEGGLYVLQLGLDTEADADALPLVLERVLLSDYGDPEAEVLDPEERQRAVLAEQVTELTFDYYGRTAADEEPGWHEEWLDQGTLPILVRMRVALATGESWPEFVAHPRLGAERQEEMAPEFEAEGEAAPPEAEESPREK